MDQTAPVGEIPPEISQLASEVQARIASLESLFAEDLKGEMDALKATLIENPSAAALLLDEDVGLLVKNLMRITQVAIVEASSAKTRTKKEPAKKLSPEEIQAALEAEGL